jgi:hypothetical protein
MMHKESIHRYSIPRCRVISIASRKVFGRAETEILLILSGSVSLVVIAGLELPQQCERVVYWIFFRLNNLPVSTNLASLHPLAFPTYISLLGQSLVSCLLRPCGNFGLAGASIGGPVTGLVANELFRAAALSLLLKFLMIELVAASVDCVAAAGIVTMGGRGE